MKTFLVLVLLIALGAGAFWFLASSETRSDARRAVDEAADRVEQVGESIEERFENLDTDKIKEELAKTGRVARRTARAASEMASDAAITAKIKTKLAANEDVSALRISVETTDGVVTLSGKASSAEEIKQAMVLALETDGVQEVISTIQIRQASADEGDE